MNQTQSLPLWRVNLFTLYISLLAGLMIATLQREAFAQKDMGVGFCTAHGQYSGSSCPRCSSGGGGGSYAPSYNPGPSAADIAAQQAAQERQQRLHEAHVANEQGNAFYSKGDLANAVAYFQEAANKNPDSEIIRQNLATAKTELQNQQVEAAAAAERQRVEAERVRLVKQRDNAAVGKMQQIAKNFSKTIAQGQPSGGLAFISPRAAQPTAALEFGDATTGDAFGGRKSNPKLITAAPGKTGSDTKAGDQLAAAAAEAAKGSQSDLTLNFDAGGAPNAGSLVAAHTLNAGPPPMDTSHFSERAKKDPEIIAGLNGLSELQSKRIKLDAERTQLTKECGLETDAVVMQKKTALVDQAEKNYQANLKAITDKTTQIEKRREEIRKDFPELPGL